MDFRKEVLEVYPKLKFISLRLTKNDKMRAEDLVQSTILKAFENESKFVKGTNLSAWLNFIMKNIFINDYRKNIGFNKVSNTIIYISPTFIDPSVQLDCKIKLENIYNFLNPVFGFRNVNFRLKEKYKPLLMYSEGYTYEEISEILGIPLGTIKSKIHHTRKAIIKYSYDQISSNRKYSIP